VTDAVQWERSSDGRRAGWSYFIYRQGGGVISEMKRRLSIIKDFDLAFQANNLYQVRALVVAMMLSA
jgi:hypothetical protein